MVCSARCHATKQAERRSAGPAPPVSSARSMPISLQCTFTTTPATHLGDITSSAETRYTRLESSEPIVYYLRNQCNRQALIAVSGLNRCSSGTLHEMTLHASDCLRSSWRRGVYMKQRSARSIRRWFDSSGTTRDLGLCVRAPAWPREGPSRMDTLS